VRAEVETEKSAHQAAAIFKMTRQAAAFFPAG
jgi:hypothetical protein